MVSESLALAGGILDFGKTATFLVSEIMSGSKT